MPLKNCTLCGKPMESRPLADPRCTECRDALALSRWLNDLVRELAQLALWDANAAMLAGREAVKARRALDGPRRRLEEWLQLAAKTLETRRVGGPLVPKLRVAPLVQPRLHEVIDVLRLVIRNVDARR
jgi:hypothetical protein